MKFSVVNFDKVQEQKDMRFDADYYLPQYLELENALRKRKSVPFGSLVTDIRTGPFGSTMLSDTYSPDGVIVVRPFNIKNFTIESENLVYVSEKDVVEKGLKYYSPGDLFFSRVGDVRCGVVPDFERKLTISPNIIAAKANFQVLNPYYAAIFFNSKYGFPQIERGLKVVAQPTIQSDLIKGLKIILLDRGFQELIEKLFQRFFKLEKQSRILYQQAEQILLSELGVSEWKSQYKLSFVQNYADVNDKARWDAEYFHPEKSHYLDQLNRLSGLTIDYHFKSVKDLLDPLREGSSEIVYNFDLTDALKYFLDSDVENVRTNELGSSKKRFKTKDIVVSRLRSYLKEIAIVSTPKSVNCVGSSEFIVLRQKTNLFHPETLLVYLRSPIVQSILKWGQNGSNHPRFDEQELLNIKLPERLLNVQDSISQTVQIGIETHRNSKKLLEIAQRAVEIAIEQDETTAIAYIEANI